MELRNSLYSFSSNVTLGLSVTEKFGISGISLIASNSAAILNVLLKITPCLFLVDDARGLSRLSSSKLLFLYLITVYYNTIHMMRYKVRYTSIRGSVVTMFNTGSST
jgi:hypothetical protein